MNARERWKVEQGYQQLKEELGMDHFEGRSWQGLHHHIALTFMAFDFLQLERAASKKNLAQPFRRFAAASMTLPRSLPATNAAVL